MVAVHVWLERDELIHLCRPIGHVFRQRFEVFQGFMDDCGKSNPFAFDLAKGFLHLAEQSPSSGEGKCHRAQFVEDTVPFIHAYPVLGARY